MMPATLHRATLALGIAAVASCLFALTAELGETLNLIHVRGASTAALAALGVLASVAGVRKLAALGLVSGLGFVASALLQLVQLGRPLNLLGGDGSTVSLLGGLGIGLVSVWLVGRPSKLSSKGTP